MGSVSGKAIYIQDTDTNNGTLDGEGQRWRKNRPGIQKRNILRTECVGPGTVSFLLARLSSH